MRVRTTKTATMQKAWKNVTWIKNLRQINSRVFLCDLSFCHIFAFANVTKDSVTIQKFIVRIISFADYYHMVFIIGNAFVTQNGVCVCVCLCTCCWMFNVDNQKTNKLTASFQRRTMHTQVKRWLPNNFSVNNCNYIHSERQWHPMSK